MARHYIRDTFNPRGAEYAATSRAADSAADTKQAMDDMLSLAMAPDERTRQDVARSIYARKRVEATGLRIGNVIRNILLALFGVFCVLMWQLGDDSSAISGAYNTFMATPSHAVPDDANTPAR